MEKYREEDEIIWVHFLTREKSQLGEGHEKNRSRPRQRRGEYTKNILLEACRSTREPTKNIKGNGKKGRKRLDS